MLNDETPESISVTLRLAIITEKPMNKGMQVIYESMTAKSIKKRIGSHTDTLPPLIICSQLSEHKSNHLFD